MMAILRCFWTDRAIWVKSIATLELLVPLKTLAERAARSAASEAKCSYAVTNSKIVILKLILNLVKTSKASVHFAPHMGINFSCCPRKHECELDLLPQSNQ